MPASPTQAIVVQITDILYRKPESPWCIIKTNPCASGNGAEVAATRGLVCKGTIDFDVNVGDRLQLEGYFGPSKFNPGEQEFSFRSAMPNLPLDLASLLHYAVSITKGLAEVREMQIWSKYGETWIQQERLDIDGIPEKTQFAWADTIRKLREQQEQTQAMAFLMSRGCTLAMATAAWNEWKNDTVSKVNGNFYVLAQLPRYGFLTVDQRIRPYFDMKDDDPRRLRAAILYAIGLIGDGGDTFIDMGIVEAEVKQLVPLDGSSAYLDAIDDLERAGMIVLKNSSLAISDDWKNESEIYEAFAP